MKKLSVIQWVCVSALILAIGVGVGLMIADYFIKGDYLLDAGIMTTILGSILPIVKLIKDYSNGNIKKVLK